MFNYFSLKKIFELKIAWKYLRQKTFSIEKEVHVLLLLNIIFAFFNIHHLQVDHPFRRNSCKLNDSIVIVVVMRLHNHAQ